MQKLKLKNWGEWRKYCKGELTGKPRKPDNIPAAPYTTYKDRGWSGCPDFLGTAK